MGRAPRVTTQTYEIGDQETIDTLLVPSTRRSSWPEIEDPAIRAGVVEELMRTVVLPALHAGRPAARSDTTSIGRSGTSGRWPADAPVHLGFRP